MLRLGRAISTAVAGGLAIVIALAFGAWPLLVVGVALGTIGVVMAMWTLLTAGGATIRRQLFSERVLEGEPLEARLVLAGGWLGLPLGRIHDPVAGELMGVPRGRAADIRVLTRFERRGLRALAPPVLEVHDPLQLAYAFRTSSQPPQEVLVLPRTEPIRYLRGEGAFSIGTARARADVLAAIEIDGLRAYVPGTPASRIYWQALARGTGLLERKLRVAGDTLPLVVLDARGPEPVGAALRYLDAAVRAAASLTLELARSGGCRLLLPGDRRPHDIATNLLGWPAAHARLAVIEGGRRARAPSPGAIQGTLGPLFYVVAQRLERLPVQLGAGHGRSAILVVPSGLNPTALGQPAFTVAGCVGYVVGARARAHARSTADVGAGNGSAARP